MALLRNKNRYEFGPLDPRDDLDIDVHRMRRASGRGIWFESMRLLRDIILILAIFVLFGVFVAQPVVVDGESMVPELHEGERLLVNKLIYYNIERFDWGHIQRGDIVVFWYPQDPNKSFVKRVIGLPGELVEVRRGRVYIDGKLLEEPYLSPAKNRSSLNYSGKRVDDHYFFVMGDNRDNSLDSRTWGLVPEKYIYGKAFFRYWRPSNLGILRRGAARLKDPERTPPRDRVPDDDDPRARLNGDIDLQ